MSRRKKLLMVLAVVLLFLGDYLYWTGKRPLNACLPDAVYSSVKADLIYYDTFFDSRHIEADDAMLAEILQAIDRVEVTRRPKFNTMSEPFFYLYLYYPNGYTRITIVQNGDISVVPDHRSDRQLYFDGGEGLYQYLQNSSLLIPNS